MDAGFALEHHRLLEGAVDQGRRLALPPEVLLHGDRCAGVCLVAAGEAPSAPRAGPHRSIHGRSRVRRAPPCPTLRLHLERRPVAEPVHLTQLTPLSFLGRSSEVFPEKTAVVHGSGRLTYRALAEAATRLALALKASGVEPGDRVAYLCPNIPELLVAHFGVPLAGAVLVAINTRLSSEEIRYILEHSGAKLLVVDTELTPLLEPILEDLGGVEEIVAVNDIGREPSVEATPFADLMARGGDRARRLGGRRREPHHLDQLHQRHHGKTQGCDVHPQGCLSQRAGRGDPLPPLG